MNITRRHLPALGITPTVPWIVLAGGLGAVDELSRFSTSRAQELLTVALAVFFSVLLMQLMFAAVGQANRRTALLVLLVAVALWAAGSAILNGTSDPDLTRFPSPGEGFFLVSYMGIAAFLVLDARDRVVASAATWLETTVICGGAACIAGAVLISPVAADFGGSGLALLLALLYPLIDSVLALLVLAQVVLRLRHLDRRSVSLCAGFTLWAVADAQFTQNLSRGTYDYTIVNDLCWGAGFAFVVWAATQRSPRAARPQPRRMSGGLMITASGVAIAVLVMRPSGTIGVYLLWPAVVTMLAAGGRLVVALRESNQANEAFALSRSDDLTMLPNRRAILARLDQALLTPTPLSLMILDLDGFKDINDTLGHLAGDVVLQVIGHRMRSVLPGNVMIARLGGDEFAAIVSCADQLALMETARVILDSVREPVTVDGVEVTTDASVGITTRTTTDTRSGELLRRADVAMYQAKRSRAGVLLYDPEADDFSVKKLQLSEDLRKGITDGQIALWYQPQIDAHTNEVDGLEALVRWNHPEHGLLSPALFLPAARRAGLMLRLSEEVARLAVDDLHHWTASGLHLRVAINCAPPELMSGAFMPRLYEFLKSRDVDMSQLTIEVTEDSFLAEPERARTVLLDIRNRGLHIAIDDYGTGFSSLSYLRDLPINELKIDRSFISTMTTDHRSRMIVASTIQMAHAIGLRTVAEGIEDEATAKDLIHLGVDVLQGYHFAKPMPGREVQEWLGNRDSGQLQAAVQARRAHPRATHRLHDVACHTALEGIPAAR